MKRIYGHGYALIDDKVALSAENPVSAHQLTKYYAQTEREYAYPNTKDPEEWRQWRETLTEKLLSILCLDRLGHPPAPSFEVISSEMTTDYIRKKIIYQTMPSSWVTAYLLVPHHIEAPISAALAVHGHFPEGKNSVVFPEKAAGIAYAHELAKNGVLVLAPDNAGMADAANVGTNERDVSLDYVTEPHMGGCDLLWRRLNHMGLDITGFRIFELLAGLNMLATMPEVDASRIGCAGLSGGCWLSQILAALDERITAVVLSGYFTTFVQTAWIGHCVCHHPFGIGKVCDMPDISAMIAPRPQFVESGTLDTAYPVEPAYSMVKQAYTRLGSPNNIDIDCFVGGHRFQGEKSIPWLVKQLSSTVTKP